MTSNHPHISDCLRDISSATHPDPRTSILGSYELKEQWKEINEITLIESVPKSIKVQFETVRNLYLYSWFVYRFYPIAEHNAYICVEHALRLRFYNEIPNKSKYRKNPKNSKYPSIIPLKTLLEFAVKEGYIRNEGFSIWRHQVQMRANLRYNTEVIRRIREESLKEIIIDESDIKITNEDRNWDYVSILLKTIPFLRNAYAHGSNNLDNQVIGTIRIVSEIINQIYV